MSTTIESGSEIEEERNNRIITYQMLETLPTRNFEKYLIVSPLNQDDPSETWTPVPAFIAMTVVKFREKFDCEIKEGETFVEAPEYIRKSKTEKLADEIFTSQTSGGDIGKITSELTAQELFEAFKEFLRRFEEPLFTMSEKMVELLQSGEYAQLMMHRSVQIERLVDDVQVFLEQPNKTFDDVTKRMNRLYHEDDTSGGKGRAAEVQAKNHLRSQVRKELLNMPPMRSNALRFLMRNITYSINYYIYKMVWRMRLKSGLSHKEAKGVIQPEVERNALRRFSNQLGPLIIGLPPKYQAKLTEQEQEKFKVKTLHDLLTFVNARCWFTFQKKEKMFEPELACHKGCSCGFG